MHRSTTPLIALVLLASSVASAQTVTVGHSGYLLGSNDEAISGSYPLRFRVYDDPSAGTLLWTGEVSAAQACAVDVHNGYYAVTLGGSCGAGLAASLFATGATLWLEVEVSNVALSPRTSISPAPAAVRFSGALSGDVTGTQGSTIVGLVGGATAANVATATGLALAATSSAVPETLVRRDATGSVSAATGTFTSVAITQGAATGHVLTSNASGQASWQAPATVPLATGVSGTLATNRGGTGLAAIGTANQVLGVKSDASGLEYKTLTAGSNVTITQSAGAVTIDATGSPWAVASGLVSYPGRAAVGASSIADGTVKLLVTTASAADTKVEVNANGDHWSGLRLQNAVKSWVLQDAPASGNGRFRIYDESGGAERFALTTGGAELFRHQDTLSYLDYYNTNAHDSAGVDLRLVTAKSSGSGQSVVDLVKYRTGGFWISNSDTAGFIGFNVNSGERARIDNAGNVGIGTSVPTARLEVSGDVKLSGGGLLRFADGSTQASAAKVDTSSTGVERVERANVSLLPGSCNVYSQSGFIASCTRATIGTAAAAQLAFTAGKFTGNVTCVASSYDNTIGRPCQVSTYSTGSGPPSTTGVTVLCSTTIDFGLICMGTK